MWTKRLLDITCSVFTLTLLSPLMITVAIIIKLTSRGPVFYRIKCIGQDKRNVDRRKDNISSLKNRRNGERRILDLKGKPFYLLKFRTAVDVLENSFTYNKNQRITQIGSFLHKTKIEVLPSLINVIRGDMSLVGPRPVSPERVSKYGMSAQEIFRVKPGITGPSQLKYQNEKLNSYAQDENKRNMLDILNLDRAYIKNWSFSKDFKIIGQSITHLF